MKSKVISLRVSASLYDKMQKKLAKYQTVSQWLRERIEENIKKEK